MTNSKQTKKALLSSVIALILCLSMLIGTTFAWFTDSVSSGLNEIKAGNLDIELYHTNRYDTNEKVTSQTVLFDNVDPELWEPGAMVYETLTVKNAGTLALKYQLAINFKDATEVNGHSLAEALKVAVVPGGFAEGFNRDTLKSLTYNEDLASFVLPGELLKGESDTYGIVIYWEPSENDNWFNMNNGNQGETLSIELGVQLVATQKDVESDSFGPDYDEDAWMPEMQIYSAQDLQAAINAGENNLVLMDDIEITDGPIVIPASGATSFSLRATPPAVKIDLNGKTLTGTTGRDADNNRVHVLLNEGNLILVGGTITSAGVNGGSAICNNGTMTVENVAINGAPQSDGSYPSYAVNNYGVMTINNCSITSYHGGIANNGSDAKVELNDVALTVNGFGGSSHCFYNSGDLTVNSGYYIHNGNGDGTVISNSATTIVNGGTFVVNGGAYGPALSGGTLYVTGGDFSDITRFYEWGGAASVTGGTFGFAPTKFAADGFCGVDNGDGTFIVVPGENTILVAEGLYYDTVDTYYVYNAAGLAAVAAEINKVDEYEANIFDGKNVLLMNDIDFGGAEWTPIGNFGSTSKQFKGVFDGQGYTVSNFQITQKSPDREGKNRSPEGFFGNVNGTIKNLTIADATVKVLNDGRFVGGLIGRLNGGLVEDCHVVNCYVEGSAWQIGAIVGQINSGTIKNCTVEDTTVAGKAGVGAVAGFQMDSNLIVTIENCAVKDCAIVQNGSYGEGYDDMFAGVIGCLNNSTSTVIINSTTVEGTTIKGEATNAVYGYVEEGATLIIDGYKMIADGLFQKDGKLYRVYNAEGLAALNSMMANKTAGKYVEVYLMADIDFTGKVWTTVDSHADTAFFFNKIDGQGHTIFNLTVNGQAMFRRFAGSGDVVIKDLTFDGANINSNGQINTSILTVQTYQNVLLDNVDVKNSTIMGGYKVAPLIATVYNEKESSITATLKNCDVINTVVTAISYDFCTTGMVAFVNAGDNDKIEFENCTVTNVQIYAPNVYTAHAWVYTTGSSTLFNEVEGVTVTNCTFENN